MSTRNMTPGIKRPMMPKAVIVAYGNGSGQGYGSCDNEYHLEFREVLDDGTLGAAKAVSSRFMSAVAKSFGKKAGNGSVTPRGTVPPNILYADLRPGRTKIVWWNAPKRRTLTFTKGVALADGEYNMPGVIYYLEQKTLHVFAFAGKHPTGRSRLLMGPFFNYYNDGRMCLGNSRLPSDTEPTWDTLLKSWESVFWNSLNSHPIQQPLHVDLVKAVGECSQSPFNTDLCKQHPAKIKLSDLLKRL